MKESLKTFYQSKRETQQDRQSPFVMNLANSERAKARLGRASENELDGQAHQYLKEKWMEEVKFFRNWDSEKQACLREAWGDFTELSDRSSGNSCVEEGASGKESSYLRG